MRTLLIIKNQQLHMAWSLTINWLISLWIRIYIPLWVRLFTRSESRVTRLPLLWLEMQAQGFPLLFSLPLIPMITLSHGACFPSSETSSRLQSAFTGLERSLQKKGNQEVREGAEKGCETRVREEGEERDVQQVWGQESGSRQWNWETEQSREGFLPVAGSSLSFFSWQ